MRVLIVGCGYVGRPLGAELVKQGHEVFGLRRSRADELGRAGIKPLVADITQPAALAELPRDYDWVVNCVASGGGGVEDYRRLYLQGTRNLIEWLAASPPRKFVYTSSTGVYGQNDGSTVDETSPAQPESETAQVLAATEKLLLDAACQSGSGITAQGSRGHSPHPFPAVILRVAGIYGPSRGYWLKQFLRGEARIEGAGGRTLNMIHRDDLIGVIVAALRNGRAGGIYNAVDDEPVSQLHFFQWLSRTLGQPLPISVPVEAAAARRRGVTDKKVSNRRLKLELGYQFQYPNFRQGYTAELERLNRPVS